MADLQDIVEDLEAEIRRPISVEDRRWRLLAHSAQPDETDQVRRHSIMSRETSPEVAAWLEGLGLQRARELVDLPSNPALGMTRRGCLPLRHGDVLLGFLWVIVGENPLTEIERAALERGGKEAANNLWGRLQEADERRRRVNAVLEAAARGDTSELASTLRWPPTGAYAVAVTTGGTDVAERLKRRRSDFAWVEHGDGVLFLARDPEGLADSLTAAGGLGGVSSRFAALDQTPAALREAETAALVARATEVPVAAYDALGSWGLIARLWEDAGRPLMLSRLSDLYTQRRGELLLEALEGLLEAGGDVAAAAKALHVHRATLYRRLERVEELTGLDLSSGDDRLYAHLALRLQRLYIAQHSRPWPPA